MPLERWLDRTLYKRTWNQDNYDWSDLRSMHVYLCRVQQLLRGDVALLSREWHQLFGAFSSFCHDVRIMHLRDWSNIKAEQREKVQAAALEMVVECIHTMADFVLQCSSQARSRTSIVIFWWAICGYRPPLEMYYNDFDKMPASEKRVRAVLFDVLARQVREPDEALQEGALYGLSLLADPRTPGLIASVRAQLATEELRRMAGWAARFELR